MGCAGLMEREDTKPVTKYESLRGMKANDREKETWLYFIQWKSFQTFHFQNNHPGVFCSMMSMCFCLGFKALCEGKSAATPCKLFFSSSFQPLCDLWSVLVRPQVHILPHTPAHPSDSPADSYAKFWFIITKDRIRAPSLQHFLRTKLYGLKHKHRQVPCQFSHSSLHYS